jgi:hypothetical protein
MTNLELSIKVEVLTLQYVMREITREEYMLRMEELQEQYYGVASDADVKNTKAKETTD